jgi:hypothetical protein
VACGQFTLLAADGPPTDCRCLALLQDAPSDPSTADDPPGRAAEKEPPSKLAAFLVSAGAVAGSTADSFIQGPHQKFHFGNEGWFGASTYAGGADKASHFVDFHVISKEFALLYEKLRFRRDDSIWMGLGVALLTGLVTEIGDGTTKYGFSYEELVMDTAGAASGALVVALKADDLVGFRKGF